VHLLDPGPLNRLQSYIRGAGISFSDGAGIAITAGGVGINFKARGPVYSMVVPPEALPGGKAVLAPRRRTA
jgi:hypothetical protein